MRSYPRREANEWDGRALAWLRHGLYRMFAAALGEPDSSKMESLREASRLLAGQGLEAFNFHEAVNRFVESLEGEPDLEEMVKEHTALFSVGVRGPPLLPQESAYLAPPGEVTGYLISQVSGEYERFGLTMPPDPKVLPDHASVEMEALALLCEREAVAWQEESVDLALQTIERERAFLEEHLGRWFSAFAHDVCSVAGAGFYATVVAAADAFIQHDIQLLRLMPEEVADAG